jgi:hypothetical protein
MAPSRRPSPDPEQELKIVRKFLRRDHLDELVEALLWWRDRVRGIKICGMDEAVYVVAGNVPLNFTAPAEWDSHGFFDPGESTRVTIPEGLGGRYLATARLRWTRDDIELFSVEDAHAGHFYGDFTRNGGPHYAAPDARYTVSPAVGAQGTTLQFSWEADLYGGDFIELRHSQSVREGMSVHGCMTLRRLGRSN